MKTLIPISKAQADKLAAGNEAGRKDYSLMREPVWDVLPETQSEIETEDDLHFVRGYVAGYRSAKRGKPRSFVQFQWLKNAATN